MHQARLGLMLASWSCNSQAAATRIPAHRRQLNRCASLPQLSMETEPLGPAGNCLRKTIGRRLIWPAETINYGTAAGGCNAIVSGLPVLRGRRQACVPTAARSNPARIIFR
jgi:hypothetical protein